MQGRYVTSLCVGAAGQVWVGTEDHGVSVFDGHLWRCYDRLSGPLSERVCCIVPAPTGDAVWIAGNLGVASYHEEPGRWQDLTRAGGLASDQITAVAVAGAGRLLVGTACDGVRLDAKGPQCHAGETAATQPCGEGLPSDQINALLVAPDGAVYAGTPNGLGFSGDGGRTWRFRRGADWAAKAPALSNRSVVALLTAEAAADAYSPPHRLLVRCGASAWANAVAEAVRSGIAEEIRGRHIPMGLELEIGEHDLVQDHAELVRISRAAFSVRLFGYGTPNDWAEYERQVFALPELQAAKAALEEILGPLAQCYLWHI